MLFRYRPIAGLNAHKSSRIPHFLTILEFINKCSVESPRASHMHSHDAGSYESIFSLLVTLICVIPLLCLPNVRIADYSPAPVASQSSLYHFL